MKTRVEIKEKAKEILKSDYGACMLPYLLLAVVTSVASGITLGIGIFLIYPIQVGMYLVYLMHWRREHPSLEIMFTSAFQENFLRKLGGMLLTGLYTFLWSLLFVIPGIIKNYSYAMTPYLLAKYPNVTATNAIRLSQRIMNGNKMNLFVMNLSFFGWSLLGVITFSLSTLFWSGPYSMLAYAGCFDEYLHDALESGRISEEELQGQAV